jgi:hypothetical protein
MGLSLKMVLNGAVPFRACSAVINIMHRWFPQLRAAPTHNTVQSWVLRLGLDEIQRTKERADDWILLVDHTLQLGSAKCLLIVGIRQVHWEQLARPLAHHDLTVFALEPVKKSDGEKVNYQLEAVAEQIGAPLAILSDEGSDIANGTTKFREKHPETQVFNDIAHKAAIFLKRELLGGPNWEAFVKHCGQTQPKVKQTELGHLAPPTQKVKARYMNLGPLIRWGAKMLRLVEMPVAERPKELDSSRLDERLGWIRDFREALEEWNDLETVKDFVLEYTRVEGYHAAAGEELRQKLKTVARTTPGQRLAAALVEFVSEQSQHVTRGKSLPASSEVLESLIGKGKRLQGQHSRGGFTKMILGMAASVTRISHDRISEALETIRNVDLLAWCNEKLGPSLTAQRRRALPAIIGTTTG